MAVGDDNKISANVVKSNSERTLPFVPWNSDSVGGQPVSVWNSDFTLPLIKKGEDIQIPFRPAEEMETEIVPLAEALTEREIQMYGNGEEVINSVSQVYNKNFNVTKNLFAGSAADLDKCLEGTKMAGNGAAFLDAQKKYGVNALFLMAIVEEESGYGAAPAKDKSGIKRYNVAGLKKKGGGYQNNSSYSDCIDSLGSMLQRLYFKNGRMTVEKIRQLYCRGNLRWAGEIVKNMKNISSEILRQYGV